MPSTENTAQQYPCECCGYYTLAAPPPGTDQQCMICGWIDYKFYWNDDDFGFEYYLGELRFGQEQFQQHGACDEKYIGKVRPISLNDRRVVGFKTINQQCREASQKVLKRIDAAFCDVKRGNGRTLHQALAIDGHKDSETIEAAKEKDTDERWQDIPDEIVARLDIALTYMDFEGFRYYLPAYLSFALRYCVDKGPPSLIPDGFIRWVGSPESPLSREYYGFLLALEPEQLHAVHDFLVYAASDFERGGMDGADAYASFVKRFGRWGNIEAEFDNSV